MRLPFLALLALLALAACAADPVLLPDSGPCSSACGAGTVCQAGACVAVDAGSDAGGVVDLGAPEDRPQAVDLGAPDVGVDAGSPMDVQQSVDAGGPVDTDPRQSEVCRGVTTTCDGRTVNVQGGEVDGGRTYHCGACGVTCAVGMGCLNCVCIRL